MNFIYLDIISLMPIKSYNNNQYLITFKYNKFKIARVYIIKSKGEITDYFIYFKKYYERLDLN